MQGDMVLKHSVWCCMPQTRSNGHHREYYKDKADQESKYTKASSNYETLGSI